MNPTHQPATPFERLRELEAKCLPVESWHPENWDAFTIQWLRSEDGANTLAMLSEFRHLLPALLNSHAAQAWQPIETAPQDGTEILGWREDAGVLLIRWTYPIDFLTESECENLGDSAEQFDWFYADFVSGGRMEGAEAPTHWMPLPPMPPPPSPALAIATAEEKPRK